MKNKIKISFLIILVFGLMFFGFSYLDKLKSIQGPQLCYNKKCFSIQIADTPIQRQVGLMNREYLADDEGMLFIFDKPGIYSFWMKNTLIALDIIWLDEDYNIIYISSDTPPCKSDPCPGYGPKQSAQYVFEINGGLSQKLGIKTGDKFIYKD